METAHRDQIPTSTIQSNDRPAVDGVQPDILSFDPQIDRRDRSFSKSSNSSNELESASVRSETSTSSIEGLSGSIQSADQGQKDVWFAAFETTAEEWDGDVFTRFEVLDVAAALVN
jgi:hypothetical protein